MPNELTVFAPVRPGQEHALRTLLRRIGDDVRGKNLGQDEPFIDFARTRTHFARFTVLPDPDSGAGRCRLLFAAIHDGERPSYLGELVDATRGMDAIWGACEGYPGVQAFPQFIADRSVESNAFYQAFREHTLADVRRFADASRDFDSGVSSSDREDSTDSGNPALAFFRRVLSFQFFLKQISFLKRVSRTAMEMFVVGWRHGFWNSFRAGLEIAASLSRIRPIRWINWITRNRMPPLTTNYSEVSLDGCSECVPQSASDEVVDPAEQWRMQGNREDRVAQNQLTLVTVTSPSRLRRQRAVMALIHLYSRRVSKPGLLAGISTIHFVRWTIIDNGKRLIMISDYDGSWEAYIEEFAAMILSGLDAIWSGSEGFPRNGARDLPAFKRFLRCRQYQADVFYSGYPRETVLNLLESRKRPLAARNQVPHVQ
ncbi:MAG: hypothetical protein KIT83_18960 [Bryobacterales bacterium]|nr:hypothetical protein [Bryobacterales bacterium]